MGLGPTTNKTGIHGSGCVGLHTRATWSQILKLGLTTSNPSTWFLKDLSLGA